MTPVHPKKNGSRIVLVASMMILAAILAACSAAPAPPAGAPAATQAPAATEAPAATTAPTEAPAAATQAPAATEAPAATAVPTDVPAPTEAAAAPAAAAVSFSKDVMPVFEQSCIKCHGGSDGTKGDLDLTSYDNLMAGGKDGQVVSPGDAANSMLVKLMDQGKMPRRQPRLPQETIDMIAAWVNQGAQNN
jgi:hypothetical protein